MRDVRCEVQHRGYGVGDVGWRSEGMAREDVPVPKSTHVKVRRFGEADLEALQRLAHETIDACYPAAYPPEAVRFFREYHSQESILKDAEDGLMLVVESGEAMVATGTLIGDYVSRVFVHPGHQRRGYGALVMSRLEEAARDAGVRAVLLEASLPSKPFYDSLGYETVCEDSFEVEGGQRLEFYRMRKSL